MADRTEPTTASAVITNEGPPATEVSSEPYWPEDWRESIAARAGGGDQRAVAKELKRLQRFADPAAIYGSERALEAKLSEGGQVRLPGERASAEEVAAFRKALGVPDRPEDYFALIELPDGAVIGEADRPIADAFAAAVHRAGATPAVVSAALGWYFASQEDQAAELDAADEAFRAEAEATLRAAWGPRYRARLNAIGTLFAGLPGGADPDGDGVFARLMAGRTADGRQIGDDPDILKALAAWALEITPTATIANASGETARAIDAEIAEIETAMRTDRAAYFRDDARQARYRELLAIRERSRR